MSGKNIRERLHSAILNSEMFRLAYLALFVVTAIFCGASALAIFQNYGIKGLILGMILCHVALVVGALAVFRFCVRQSAALPFPKEKYRFFFWVVARNSLIHVGVYLFFAFLNVPVFRPDPSGADYEAGAVFAIMAVMSAAFVAVRGRSTLDAAHHS
jgi:hypothetical protein